MGQGSGCGGNSQSAKGGGGGIYKKELRVLFAGGRVGGMGRSREQGQGGICREASV